MEIPTDLIYEHFSEIHFSKGDYLLRSGEIEKHLYYIFLIQNENLSKR
ncbi:hypothetical protein [Capnocytophaga felis]|nr:hypothetical protein [Capnocytophaga felis]